MSAIEMVSEAHKEIYHYTTALGLDGILRSQQLWATHTAYHTVPSIFPGTGLRLHFTVNLLHPSGALAIIEIDELGHVLLHRSSAGVPGILRYH